MKICEERTMWEEIKTRWDMYNKPEVVLQSLIDGNFEDPKCYGIMKTDLPKDMIYPYFRVNTSNILEINSSKYRGGRLYHVSYKNYYFLFEKKKVLGKDEITICIMHDYPSDPITRNVITGWNVNDLLHRLP